MLARNHSTPTPKGNNMNTVRVSILNVPAEHIDHVAQLMIAAEEELAGIKELPGLISYYAGIDRTMNQLSNVSVWESDEHAKAMLTFQPMLDLGARFLEVPGLTFVRPIPNFNSLWEWA
jgi:hypothetical protein